MNPFRSSRIIFRAIGSKAPQRQPGESAGTWSKAEEGQAIVETALALPLLVAFTFILIEACLAFYSYSMISESAREGSRYAIVHGSTCQTLNGASCTASATDVSSYVSNLGFPNLGGGKLIATTTYPDGNENPGSRVRVVVNYVFPFNVPFASKGSLHMSSASSMYIIQ